MADSGAPPTPWSALRWTSPRFATLRDLVDRVTEFATWPTVAALDERLAITAPGGRLRLVAGEKAPRRRREPVPAKRVYELRIVDDGEVPTRAGNLHDLCNALIWAAYPRAKWQLTARIAALQRARLRDHAGRWPTTRSRDHDTLALFDEGGVALLGDRGHVFGHAILEHTALGVEKIRAAVRPLALIAVPDQAIARRAAIDVALGEALVQPAWASAGPGALLDDRWFG